MYFVTTKREPYVLFCTTPSERGALGLTEKRMVHFLTRRSAAEDWTVVREWNASEYSHTDFLAALHHVDEPDDPLTLLNILPAHLRRPVP